MVPISDHSPILLETDGARWCEKVKRVKFENIWLSYSGVFEVIREVWEDYRELIFWRDLIFVCNVCKVEVKPFLVIS